MEANQTPVANGCSEHRGRRPWWIGSGVFWCALLGIPARGCHDCWETEALGGLWVLPAPDCTDRAKGAGLQSAITPGVTDLRSDAFSHAKPGHQKLGAGWAELSETRIQVCRHHSLSGFAAWRRELPGPLGEAPQSFSASTCVAWTRVHSEGL